MFTHKCDTGNLSALIQCWNIEQQRERDCFSVAKRRSIYIYTTLAFLALLGAPYIYDISSLRVNVYNRRQWVSIVNRNATGTLHVCTTHFLNTDPIKCVVVNTKEYQHTCSALGLYHTQCLMVASPKRRCLSGKVHGIISYMAVAGTRNVPESPNLGHTAPHSLEDILMHC